MNVTVAAGAGTPRDYNHSGWTNEVKRLSFPLSSFGPANNTTGFTGLGYNGFRIVTTGFTGGTNTISVDLVYSGIVFARGIAYPQQ